MRDYFKGWYFKCQSETQILAVIPAVHEVCGKCFYSIQVITEDGAHYERIEELDKQYFGEKGLKCKINRPSLKLTVDLHFTHLTPIKYDIMGLFSLVPFMQCRHSVYSMCHRVDGKVFINGTEYVFENALGYWEGDRGRSFPKEYAWTHSFIEGKSGSIEGSLMLSVADIPLAGGHFTGIIGIVFWKGKEYRFATYLGARVVQKEKGILLIRQGNIELEARLIEQKPHPLQAPVNGEMARTIHENITCKAFYRFRRNGVTQFAFETDKASFEYEYEWRK